MQSNLLSRQARLLRISASSSTKSTAFQIQTCRHAALQLRAARRHVPRGEQQMSRAATDSEQKTAESKRRGIVTHASSTDEADSDSVDFKVVGGVLVAAVIVLIAGGGYVYRDQIKDLLQWFISVVDDWGAWGYAAYGIVYTLLELVIIPAIPLTMAAGILFGVAPGVVVVSAASTAAAALSFLITRYAARDTIADLAKDNKKFSAIDKAIGKDSFKVVLLLRLSPLLPLALSNYLYGLTSVDFVPYVLGSWLGMLPGTIAYVSAGSYSRKVFEGGETGGGLASWQVALGVALTFVAIGYVGRIAKQAIDDVDDD